MNKMILETNMYYISELPIVYMVVVITKKGLGGSTGKTVWFKGEGTSGHHNQWCRSGNVGIHKTKQNILATSGISCK